MFRSGLVLAPRNAGAKSGPLPTLHVPSDDSLLVIAPTMESRMDLYVALRPLGSPIQTCATAIEGLKATACSMPALVIVDCNSLDPDGRELLDSLRQDHPGTGVILLAGPKDRARAMRTGIGLHTEILTIPVVQDELLNAARRLLSHIGGEGM